MYESIQSALIPRGTHAMVTAEIAWVLFIGGGAIFVLVMVFVAWAVFGERRAWLAKQGSIIAGGIVFPSAVLFALLIYTLLAASRITEAHGGDADLRIEVTGEQWWWRVHYLGPEGELDFATANELHIPVGRTVEIRLRSADVLHSLWVPALAGKLDLIPGKDNRLRLRAETPGVFRGQCAEYCGGPHAQMAFYVLAEEIEAFDRWRGAQRAPATGDSDLFLAHCAACHTVRGTRASGTLGPDLTHVGSRLSIGAGILPNNTGSIAGWIGSNQRIKPGNLMPEFRQLSGAESRALAHYVTSLK